MYLFFYSKHGCDEGKRKEVVIERGGEMIINSSFVKPKVSKGGKGGKMLLCYLDRGEGKEEKQIFFRNISTHAQSSIGFCIINHVNWYTSMHVYNNWLVAFGDCLLGWLVILVWM